MEPLQDQLDEITARTRELVQPERLRNSEKAVETLFASGIEERILPLGALAPDFMLADVSGKTVHLADMLSLGPVVLDFFRGRWCPYCVTELETWSSLYPELRERGALLAALAPQTVQQNDFTAQKHELPFPVLADPGCRVAEAFGLVWTVPEPLRADYHSLFVNLPFLNDDASWRLPLPATYLLDSDGRVLFAEAHADFRVRPEPAEVLTALDALLKR